MTVTATQVAVGDQLPELRIDVTPTMVIAGALASRDFEQVHHDQAHAQASGMRDIFLNILTTNGLVVRLVTDWAGPDTIVRSSKIRLGVPHFAGETLTLSGEVAGLDGSEVQISIRGRNTLGDHVTGTVTVDLPIGEGA